MSIAADSLRAGGHEDAAECLGAMRTQFKTTMLLLFWKIAYTSTNGQPSIQGSFLRAQKPGQWDSRFTRLNWSHPNLPLVSHGAYHSRAMDLSHHCESLCRRLYLSLPSRVVEGLGTYRLYPSQVKYGDQPSQQPPERVREQHGESDDINYQYGGK